MSAPRQLLQEGIAIGRESGDMTAVLYAIGILARISVSEGDALQAGGLIEEGMEFARQLKMHSWIAMMLALQAGVAVRQSDWGTAEDLYREAIHILSVGSRDA